jgi:hypothetical protein
VKEWRKWGLAGAVVLLFVVLGIFGVADALNLLIGAGVALLIVLLLWPESWWRLDVFVIRVLGAALVAFLALAGVNVLTNALGFGRLPILAGLILAVLVFGGVVFWYLHKDGWSLVASGIGAAVLAVGILLVAPYVVGKLTANTDPVPASEHVASQLDVMIVGNGSHHPPPPQITENPALKEFDVRYSVGFAAGNEVRWTLVNSESAETALEAVAEGNAHPAEQAPPERRLEADSVLLLLPDGTAPVAAEPKNLEPQQEEIPHWSQVAEAAAPGAPTYALLETTNAERLNEWKGFVPHGRAVSLQKLETPAVTEAAVELAINAPTAKADFALAMAYRPILLFDHEEPVPWPLSIAALFNEGRVTLCHDQGVAKTECDAEPLQSPRELENNGTHLRLRLRNSHELRRLARTELKAAEEETEEAPATQVPGAGSAIYVHPVSLVKDKRELLYLDYWWYLPDNPVGVGGGALCGAGFVIPGVTCQNHQSDWEGMTVVVDRTDAKPRIVAVQYAQHSDVVRYSWTQLRERWDSDAKVQALVAGIPDAATRPLAFSAEGTHATYPLPCGRCHQIAHPDLAEGPHRGDLPWVGDLTSACGKSSCLQLLPTRNGGTEPALWNAYNGPWGERHCFLTYYCDSGSPPTSPGKQGRYEHPASYDGYVNEKWEFESKPVEE